MIVLLRVNSEMIGLLSDSIMILNIVVVLVLFEMLMMLGEVSGLCSMVWKYMLVMLKLILVRMVRIVCGRCRLLMVKEVLGMVLLRMMWIILLGV